MPSTSLDDGAKDSSNIQRLCFPAVGVGLVYGLSQLSERVVFRIAVSGPMLRGSLSRVQRGYGWSSMVQCGYRAAGPSSLTSWTNLASFNEPRGFRVLLMRGQHAS